MLRFSALTRQVPHLPQPTASTGATRRITIQKPGLLSLEAYVPAGLITYSPVIVIEAGIRHMSRPARIQVAWKTASLPETCREKPEIRILSTKERFKSRRVTIYTRCRL